MIASPVVQQKMEDASPIHTHMCTTHTTRYYHLCWKTSGEMWTLADNVRLVREVSALDVDSEGNINWLAMAEGWPE